MHLSSSTGLDSFLFPFLYPSFLFIRSHSMYARMQEIINIENEQVYTCFDACHGRRILCTIHDALTQTNIRHTRTSCIFVIYIHHTILTSCFVHISCSNDISSWFHAVLPYGLSSFFHILSATHPLPLNLLFPFMHIFFFVCLK